MSDPFSSPVFQDAEISGFAKALFSIAVSMAQKGGIPMKQFIKAVPEVTAGEMYVGIMELRKFGYCKRVRVDNDTEFRFKKFPSRRIAYAGPDLKEKKKTILLFKNNTTIRESARADEDVEFADWDEIDSGSVGPSNFQLSLIPKKQKPVLGVPKAAHDMLLRICFMATSENEARLINANMRGRAANALGQLQKSEELTLARLRRFELWWKGDWRSKGRSGQYQPPRPDQVVEYWTTAMNSEVVTLEVPVRVETKPIGPELRAMMMNRAKDRNGHK